MLPVARAEASTITEAVAPSELLPSPVVTAKAGAVVAVDTFSFIQVFGSATLNSISVVIVDPGTSGLVDTDIASISLRKESGTTSGFQASEDLTVTGAVANNPAIGAPVFLTPTTPEAIGASPVQYYIVVTIAATPTDNHNLAVNFGANYGVDNISNTVGSSLTATKKVLIDITPPAAILVENFVFIQNLPGTQDQIAPAPAVSIGMQNSILKVYKVDGTTFIGQAILGSDGRFAPINIGDNANANVKLQVMDQAGNTNTMILKGGNDIVAPTVSSALAFTDRIIINFSEQIDGMMAMNCANYTIGGASTTCGGRGLPFVDVQGDKATIRGLSLSGTTSLVISSGNTITDVNGHNPLTAYSSGSLTVNALSLPSITGIANNVGGASSGKKGDTITISGTNFGTGTAGDAGHKVFFSGGFSQTTGPLPPIEADYTGATWSATSIAIKVPTGAQGGPVNVVVGGVMSDMGPNSFFDISANYVAKIYYNSTSTLMPDSDKDSIRIVIAGMRGPVVHYDGDGATIYNVVNDEFTITGVSSMGWTWAYDITGAHLNSQGQQVDTSAPQNHILTTTSRKISGTITMGTVCGAGGKNKDVVIFAMPDQVDTGGTNFKPMDPAFFKTGDNCTTSYSVGIPTNGVYRVEAHIPPDATASTVGSSAYTDPNSLQVTISDSAPTATGKDFTFTAATHKIMGIVQKPGGFGEGQKGMLWVFAYQPRENGKGTGTQVNEDGAFTLYVTAGTWKVGVGGENMSFPVEIQVDVDSTYALTSYTASTKTIIIAPPSDFIEGYVKDSAGNGLANTSLYAWLEGGPGGGNAQTDSQGYYKMYVTPGSNYHIGANSQSYGFLGEQSGIAVSSSVHPTVNFNVSSSDNFTISGTVTKGGSPLQQAFVFITDGERGQMLGSGGTDATGAYTVRVSGGTNRYLHVGLPGKGEIYLKNLGTIGGNVSENVTIVSSTIKVRISPASSFTQAFVGVHSDQGGGFSDTDVSSESPDTYREYQIDVRRPAAGSTTYYVDGGIPGYGPLPQSSVVVNSDGSFTETSGTVNDGIIEITLGGLYTVSGTVSGDNALDAWVFASGPNGGNGAAVNVSGSYSIRLRDGTYDIGVGKPGYIGNKITTIVSGADVPLQNLTLTTATNTITGKVYLPGGVTTATNAWVWAEDGSGGWAGGSTDASGNYTLNVGSGSWTVKAAYDGYNSTGILVTAPASGKNITLITISGFAPNTKNTPITPSVGGIVSGTGIKVDFPKNALGSGTSAGTVEVRSTTNIVSKNDRQMVGTAKEITARDSSNQTVTTLSGDITIELTASKAELVAANLTLAQAKAVEITYFDSTGGSWVRIDTVATLSVPSATTTAGLNVDPAITYTGKISHLSTYALSVPSEGAPPMPTNFSIAAGDGSAVLSWTASAGAAKYGIYKKVGADYPYLAQTTTTSYTATNLTNGITYYFRISALDNSTPVNKESAATEAVSAIPVVAPSTGGGGISPSALGDTAPPSISNIGVLVSGASATISWQTNEGSISWVLYGTSTAYGLEVKTTTSTASHSITLTGLSPSTAYHYQIKSKDSTGNIGSYTDKTFTTLTLGEQPKVVEEAPKVIAKPISEMTVGELKAKTLEIQQLIIKVLIQLITKLQAQIAGLR